MVTQLLRHMLGIQVNPPDLLKLIQVSPGKTRRMVFVSVCMWRDSNSVLQSISLALRAKE